MSRATDTDGNAYMTDLQLGQYKIQSYEREEDGCDVVEISCNARGLLLLTTDDPIIVETAKRFLSTSITGDEEKVTGRMLKNAIRLLFMRVADMFND